MTEVGMYNIVMMSELEELSKESKELRRQIYKLDKVMGQLAWSIIPSGATDKEQIATRRSLLAKAIRFKRKLRQARKMIESINSEFDLKETNHRITYL